MPIEICLEDVHGFEDAPRFTRCVALDGGRRGLGLDARGDVTWLVEAPVCEVFVAADGRLAMMLAEDRLRVVVGRARRRMDVPRGRPVFLLHGDDLWVGDRHVRVHVHGDVAAAAPPEPLWDRALGSVRRHAAAASLAGALGALAAVGAGCRMPPATAAPNTHASSEPACSPDGSCDTPDAGSAEPDTTTKPPIEIRPEPPKPMPR